MSKRLNSFITILKSKRYLKWRVIALVLVTLILVSRMIVWVLLDQTNNLASMQSFDMATTQQVDEVKNQFEIYANMLYAARALFLTNNSISRQDWDTFVSAQKLNERYPAFYALGYISAIHRKDIDTLTAKLNADRLPTETQPVTIYPLITGDNLDVVTYVAPSTVNQAAIGNNVLVDPTRATALAEARDSGLPRASKPLSLATDPANAPPSILIVLPIYASSADSLQTMAQRQAALQGYVVMAVRTKPLLDSIFAAASDNNIDASINSNGQVIYQHGSRLSGTALEKHQNVIVAGQTWAIDFQAPAGYGLSQAANMAPVVLSLSALPFLFIVSLILYFATRVYQPNIRG